MIALNSYRAPPELLEFFKIYTERDRLIVANIVGNMGSGKTNIAYLLAKIYADFMSIRRPVRIHYIDDDHMNRLDTVIEENLVMRSIAPVIILDDLTLIDYARGRKENSLGYKISRIRHLLERDHIFVIMVFHYITSVNPLLRIANLRIVTNITSYAEIETLKKYFMLSYLNEYIKLKEERWLDYDALLNIMGKHVIWINLPKIDPSELAPYQF